MKLIIRTERAAAQLQRASETSAGVLFPTIMLIIIGASLSSLIYADVLGAKIGTLISERAGIGIQTANTIGLFSAGGFGLFAIMFLHLSTIQTMELVKDYKDPNYLFVWIYTAIAVLMNVGGAASMLTNNTHDWGTIVAFVGIVCVVEVLIIGRTKLTKYAKNIDTATNLVNSEIDSQHEAVSTSELSKIGNEKQAPPALYATKTAQPAPSKDKRKSLFNPAEFAKFDASNF